MSKTQLFGEQDIQARREAVTFLAGELERRGCLIAEAMETWADRLRKQGKDRPNRAYGKAKALEAAINAMNANLTAIVMAENLEEE